MKMFVARRLMIVGAFLVVALAVLAGCAGAASHYEVVETHHSAFEKTTAHRSYRDASNHTRTALSAPSVQRQDDDQARRLQSIEQAQRARRTLTRW